MEYVWQWLTMSFCTMTHAATSFDTFYLLWETFCIIPLLKRNSIYIGECDWLGSLYYISHVRYTHPEEVMRCTWDNIIDWVGLQYRITLHFSDFRCIISLNTYQTLYTYRVGDNVQTMVFIRSISDSCEFCVLFLKQHLPWGAICWCLWVSWQRNNMWKKCK